MLAVMTDSDAEFTHSSRPGAVWCIATEYVTKLWYIWNETSHSIDDSVQTIQNR